MRIPTTLAAALIMAAGALSIPQVSAAASGGATMKECAAQWQTAKKDNKTGGQSYKDFSAACMAKGTAAPAPAAVVKPVAAPKPAAEPKATKASASSAPGQRMKDCGAKWQALKASNKTNGQTYQQFSKGCLSTKG